MLSQTKVDEFEAALETFQWAYPNREQNRGEVYVEDDDLILIVWCQNTDTPEDEKIYPLRVSIPIDEYTPARNQIRNIIHMYLTHEADEQMWFGDPPTRVFYPH